MSSESTPPLLLKPVLNSEYIRNLCPHVCQLTSISASSKTGILTSTISTLTFVPLQSFVSTSKIFSILTSLTSELISNSSSFSLLQWAQYVIQLGWLYNPLVPQVEFVFIPGFQPTANVAAPAANTSYAVITPVIQHPFSRGSVARFPQ